MNVLMQMSWAGVKPEQYETMRQTVNWEGNVPKGARFHVSSFDDQGIHVTDIWESADDFNNFVQTRLMKGAMDAGIEGQPTVTISPVHAVFVPAFKSN